MNLAKQVRVEFPLTAPTFALPDTPVADAFSRDALAFCQALSQRLLADPAARQQADLVALAYWLRPSQLQQVQRDFAQLLPREPRGYCLHFAPANVDTVFVYSCLLSLLLGNVTVVRLSQRPGISANAVVRLMNALQGEASFETVAARLKLIRYDHDEVVNHALMQWADQRVIWGGDETVKYLAALPAKVGCHDILFPTRVSAVCLDAKAVMADVAAVLPLFYRDTATYNQQACSSPRRIFWYGDSASVAAAQAQFWPTYSRYHAERGASLSDAEYYQRRQYLQQLEMIYGDAIQWQSHADIITASGVPYEETMEKQHPGLQLFFEQQVACIDALAGMPSSAKQTLCTYGLPQAELSRSGYTRIVPLGEALNFSHHWDGHNLLREMTQTPAQVTAVTCLSDLNVASLAPFSVISLDFFDTLAFRHVDELTLLKRVFERFDGLSVSFDDFLQAREQAMVDCRRRCQQGGGDLEYRLMDLYQACFALLAINTADAASFVLQLVAAETKNLQAIGDNHAWLSQLRAKGKRIVVSSDTAYDAAAMRDFLSHIGLVDLIDAIYVSGDCGVNKASGRLFQYLQQRENCAPPALLHIGDNELSDVAKAQQQGFKALHFQAVFEPSAYAALADFGSRLLAPLLAAFCQQLQQRYAHLHKLLFLGRDAHLLFRAYRALYPFDDRVSYGYLTRSMAFQLEHAALTPELITQLRVQYSGLGVGGVLTVLGLQQSGFAALYRQRLWQAGLTEHSAWSDSWASQLLADEVLQQQFCRDIAMRKKSLLAYLASLAITTEHDTVLVDVGWRGSVVQAVRAYYGQAIQGYLLCGTELAGDGIHAWVNGGSDVALHARLSEYRELLEFACAEPVPAISNIAADLQPVFSGAEVTAASVEARHVIASAVLNQLATGNELTAAELTQRWQDFTANINPHLANALATIDAGTSLADKTATSFGRWFFGGNKTMTTTQPSASDSKQQQTRVYRFLAWVATLQQQAPLVIYGAGSGAAFCLPHLQQQCAFIVDLDDSLHGQSRSGIDIRPVSALETFTGTVLVSVLGRKQQIAQLLSAFDCQVEYLEDVL